ncbi:MAG TPA: VWA domain-containing protein [Vicinamibacterales bacterium]|nr:VWA domain-containing protein [Vicinamibacterales bacterium]
MRTIIVLGTLLLQATFSSRTVVVVVPVSVSGTGGQRIAGLSKEHFRLYDDGRLQQITTFAQGDIPVTLGLVVDHSASMRLKLATVTDAIERLARTMRTADELFVVDFNERVNRPTFGGSAFTSDPTELRAAVAGLRAAGATALHDAVIDATQHVRHGTAERKALILISDGADNASRHTYEDTVTLVREVGAVVYAIGLSTDADDRRSYGELRRLARDSGGAAYLLQTVDEVSTRLEDIVRDLRDQYLLGFIPEKAAGSIGAIRVTAVAPGHSKLTVRSRASYTLPRSVP